MTTTTATELYDQVFAADQALEDPYSLLREIRTLGPVHQVGAHTWIATTWKTCVEVLRSTNFQVDVELMGRSWSDDWRGHPSLRLLARTLLVMNPPAHTRSRRAVAAAFTSDRVTELAVSVGAAVERLVEELEREAITGHATDLIGGFADKLPLAVIEPFLGIADWPYGDFRQQTMEFNLVLERDHTEANLLRADAAALEITDCLEEIIGRGRAHFSNDLVSDLLRAVARGQIDQSEVVPLVFQIFNASYQTTASLLGSAFASVLGPSGSGLASLRESSTLVAATVAEVLRTDPPVQSTGRHVRRAVTLADADLPEGDFVVALLASANRDPAHVVDPDEFRPGRAASPTLTFGWGLHHCLGARLATMEAETALAQLAAHFPYTRLSGSPERWPTANLRAFKRLEAHLVDAQA